MAEQSKFSWASRFILNTREDHKGGLGHHFSKGLLNVKYFLNFRSVIFLFLHLYQL